MSLKAFSADTPSGRYVGHLADVLAVRFAAIEYDAANILDEPYVGATGREQIPPVRYLLDRWEKFERRALTPDIHCIVAFGAVVRQAFSLHDGVTYLEECAYSRGLQTLVFSPHPSYIMIYRRKKLSEYVKRTAALIEIECGGTSLEFSRE